MHTSKCDQVLRITLDEIGCTLRELRQSGIAATLNTRVMRRSPCSSPLLETLAGLLQDELDRRHSRLRCITRLRATSHVNPASMRSVSTSSSRRPTAAVSALQCTRFATSNSTRGRINQALGSVRLGLRVRLGLTMLRIIQSSSLTCASPQHLSPQSQ